MALPGVLVLFVFAYLPMFGIIIAFKEYRFDQGILGSKWIGFYNFKYLFSSAAAARITRNTVGYHFLFMITGMIGLLAHRSADERGTRQVALPVLPVGDVPAPLYLLHHRELLCVRLPQPG